MLLWFFNRFWIVHISIYYVHCKNISIGVIGHKTLSYFKLCKAKEWQRNLVLKKTHCLQIDKVNKWRGVTILLRLSGQGHPTPSLTSTTPPTPLQHTHPQTKPTAAAWIHVFRIFNASLTSWAWQTDRPTDRQTNGPTDRQTKPLKELRVRNQKHIKRYILSFFLHTFSIFILKQFGHQKTENWNYAKIEQNMRIWGQKCACRATFKHKKWSQSPQTVPNKFYSPILVGSNEKIMFVSLKRVKKAKKKWP